ncbi:MAG TPA: response regulator, partial [Acidobacteriota bacterium]|nr:response regulator [Acidobacteriota bacterium]
LIVEDEIIIALDIKFTVENLGFSISGIFSSGEESIAKVPLISPDIILMDIKLNGKIDGRCAAIKIYNKYNIPSIFLTAYSDEKTLKRIHDDKLFYSISKPFSEYQISETIEKTREKFGLS